MLHCKLALFYALQAEAQLFLQEHATVRRGTQSFACVRVLSYAITTAHIGGDNRLLPQTRLHPWNRWRKDCC